MDDVVGLLAHMLEARTHHDDVALVQRLVETQPVFEHGAAIFGGRALLAGVDRAVVPRQVDDAVGDAADIELRQHLPGVVALDGLDDAAGDLDQAHAFGLGERRRAFDEYARIVERDAARRAVGGQVHQQFLGAGAHRFGEWHGLACPAVAGDDQHVEGGRNRVGMAVDQLHIDPQPVHADLQDAGPAGKAPAGMHFAQEAQMLVGHDHVEPGHPPSGARHPQVMPERSQPLAHLGRVKAHVEVTVFVAFPGVGHALEDVDHRIPRHLNCWPKGYRGPWDK